MYRRIFRIEKYYLILLTGIILFSSCKPSSWMVSEVIGERVEMSSVYDINPDEVTARIIEPYKVQTDSVMGIVIGKSAKELAVYRPESPLSNLSADILREGAAKYSSQPIDVAVTNMGGLRARLPKGDVTVGDVFEIFPFENHLCILTMSGQSLRSLLEQIAYLKGEGISGVKMAISQEGNLKRATVNGKVIDPKRNYIVATLDYLSEGNDGMTAFGEAIEKECYPDVTIRNIMLDYVVDKTKAGRVITASEDGRIIIDK